MDLWTSIEQKVGELKREFHLDPLEPRTWICEPLLVVDEVDDAIAFFGNTEVEVKPHPDGTADLIAHEERDGWLPSLINAYINCDQPMPVMNLPYIGRRRRCRKGLTCTGTDAEGNEFTWYINGASDSYGVRRFLNANSQEYDPFMQSILKSSEAEADDD